MVDLLSEGSSSDIEPPSALAAPLPDARDDRPAPLDANASVAGAQRNPAMKRWRPLKRRCVGRGRWGSSKERHLQGLVLREAKAVKRARAAEDEGCVIMNKLAEAFPRSKKKTKLSAKDLLDVGYSPSVKVTSMACIKNISKAWVRAIIMIVAAWYLAVQNLVLGSLVLHCHQHKPLLVITRLVWDETGERLTMPVKGSRKGARTSVWQVMVARMVLLVGWWDEGSTLKVFRFPIVFAPLIVSDVKAATIHGTLFGHPLNKPIFHAVSWLYKLASIPVNLNETDGAASNEKMLAYMLRASNEYWASWLCSLHQIKLIETSLCGICRSRLVSRLYSITLLLKTGGNFMKMLNMCLCSSLECT